MHKTKTVKKTNHPMWWHYIPVLLLGLLSFSASSEFELVSIEQVPALVVENQPFELHYVGYAMSGDGQSALDPSDFFSVEVFGDQIFVDYSDPSFGCLTPVGLVPNTPQRKILPLPGLPAGTYNVVASFAIFCLGREFFQRSVTVFPANEELVFNAETPDKGQIVSGIGVIRGWACYDKAEAFGEAEGGVVSRVSYQIDDGERLPLPYGSTRTDTATVCGEGNVNTGYGAVVYWGQFGEGEHEFKLFIDDQLVDSRLFEVVELEGGFQTGLESTNTIEDFPTPGASVTVEWSEADQNFIIVEKN